MCRGREGDFIELKDGSIFEIKGVTHPPYGAIAYPRYIPSEEGERVRFGRRYKRLYTFEEKIRVLKERFPRYYVYDRYYSRLLPIIPWSEVQRHFKPQDAVRALKSAQSLVGLRLKALEFIEYISDVAGISAGRIGISGSILLALDREDSDIDVVIYGLKESSSVREAILHAMAEGEVLSRLPEARLKELYISRSRDTEMRYEDFVKLEQRKSNQGLFKGTLFFVRYIRDWGEIGEQYGCYSIRRVGYARISARVADASEAHMTPAQYILEDVTVLSGPSRLTVDRLISWRGRFAEQASEGEEVVAQGSVEEVLSDGAVFRQMTVGEERVDTILPLKAYSP